MKIYNNTNLNFKHKKAVVAIGNFDGVHLGHQKVLKEANIMAKKLKLPFGAITFEPMPVMFFNKKIKNHRINTLNQKKHHLKKQNLDFLLIIKFDKIFSSLTADEFIEKLPEKYNTLIGENGVRLSGGQKQRISIARAILKGSPIILLDEATSALDAESEQIVQNAITNLTKNKTTLVIAHRLSTIHNADKIFVMNQGKVIDSGDHNFLIKNCEVYKSLYEKQLKN